MDEQNSPNGTGDNHKINDFVIRFANVNGTGLASANALFYQGGVSDGHSGDAEEYRVRTGSGSDWVFGGRMMI